MKFVNEFCRGLSVAELYAKQIIPYNLLFAPLIVIYYLLIDNHAATRSFLQIDYSAASELSFRRFD